MFWRFNAQVNQRFILKQSLIKSFFYVNESDSNEINIFPATHLRITTT